MGIIKKGHFPCVIYLHSEMG